MTGLSQASGRRTPEQRFGPFIDVTDLSVRVDDPHRRPEHADPRRPAAPLPSGAACDASLCDRALLGGNHELFTAPFIRPKKGSQSKQEANPPAPEALGFSMEQ